MIHKVIGLILIISYCSFGQQPSGRLTNINKKVDSLNKLPPSIGRDTMLVVWLNEKVNYEVVYTSNTDSSLAAALKILDLCNKIDWKFGKILTWNTLGEIENIKSRYFSTINYALKILSTADKNRDWIYYSFALRTAGAASMWLEKPQDALKYYNQYFDFMKDKLKRKTIHPSIPFRNHSLFSYYDAHTEIGILHTKYIKTADNYIALKYFKIAERYYSASNDSTGIGYMNSYLGLCYERMKKFDLAEIAFNKSIEILTKKKLDYLLADALNNASEYYLRQKKYAKATEQAQQALKIAQKIGIYFSMRDANKNLYAINEAQGNFKESLIYHKRYSAMRDSMSEVNYEDKMKVIRYETDTQRQNEEIKRKTAENERKNVLIYSLIAVLVAIITTGIFFYLNLNYRKKIAEQEIIQLIQEKQLTATESILKGQEEERSRLARDLHDGLGGLLSGIKFTLHTMTGNVVLSEQNANIFTRALTQLDNAIAEMRRVAHSMMPEALFKFGLVDALSDYCEGISTSGKMKVHFQAYQINERLEHSIEVMVFRIVQELLNNALKHAEATEAYVQLSKIDNILTLSIEDNGKGFNINDLQNNKGIGIQSIENRVAYLNGKIDIQSADMKGTSIIIEIELK